MWGDIYVCRKMRLGVVWHREPHREAHAYPYQTGCSRGVLPLDTIFIQM